MKGYSLFKSNFSKTRDMNADPFRTNIEILHPLFQGGEQHGKFLSSYDVGNILTEALKTALYKQVHPKAIPHEPDLSYFDNASFWEDALSYRHFPGAYIVLDNFHLLEWLPFSPGRYFTKDAGVERRSAARAMSKDRDEYLPHGKTSMVRGGIGAIRLAEKTINGSKIYFLGASSTGIAHQGIPIALLSDEYCKVIPIIRERGGCQVKLVGSLQTMTTTENYPLLNFDGDIPRYCLFAEAVTVKKPSIHNELLTTAAIMFTVRKATRHSYDRDKSWTFCSFHPGLPRERKRAVEWLIDYARRYSYDEPTILTDFDEHYGFPCRVEFPISDIVRGTVDWETLCVYRQRFSGGYTYIEKYIEYIGKHEENKVTGDQINVHGSGNTVVNRSIVQNAFNKVKTEYDEETANALKRVEEEINKSGNKEAAENFEAFSEELAKPEPKKSILKTLWEGTLAALPTLAQLSSVVNLVVRLFS